MKKEFFLLLFLMILIVSAFAEKVAVLAEVSRPDDVSMDKERLYIAEEVKVYVYSLKDYKLLAKFGKAGEGPQEFKVIPGFCVNPHPFGDYIYVNSWTKLSIFTKDGKFIKEYRYKGEKGFRPITADRFIGTRQVLENSDNIYYSTFNLYDLNFDKIKEIGRVESVNQHRREFRIYHSANFAKVHKEKIFLAIKKDFTIEVFDKEGNHLYTIKRDFKRRKFTANDEKMVMNWYKANPTYNERDLEYLRKHARFPDYYPAIAGFAIDNDKIYVRTHNVKEENFEFVILDIKGKYLKTQTIHLVKKDTILPYLFLIKNGKIYQIVENDEKEEWELHKTDLSSVKK